MSNQTEAILKRYPEAVSAADGVRVGDVLCVHTGVPLVIVNEGNIGRVNALIDKHASSCCIIGNADKVAV